VGPYLYSTIPLCLNKHRKNLTFFRISDILIDVKRMFVCHDVLAVWDAVSAGYKKKHSVR
jgi:hypothetical protein